VSANRPGLAGIPQLLAGAVHMALAMVLATGVSACVSNYRVAPLPEPAPAAVDTTAIGLGDLVVVHRRDGTTVDGQVVALDAHELALQPRRSAAPPVRIARADIVKVERFELSRLVTNILVVSAVVIGVVMILMSGPMLGIPSI
jgi:hypothetical protein